MKIGHQLDMFLMCADREGLQCVTDGIPERERYPFQPQLPRLDLGEIQNIVDDDQQRFGGLAYGFEIAPLSEGEVRMQSQLRHADDPVHRCADLVAHGRQEDALRSGRLLGHGFRRFEFAPLGLESLFGFLAFGDLVLQRGTLQEEAFDQRSDVAEFGRTSLQPVQEYGVFGRQRVGNLAERPDNDPVQRCIDGEQGGRRNETVDDQFRVDVLDRVADRISVGGTAARVNRLGQSAELRHADMVQADGQEHSDDPEEHEQTYVDP